MAGFDNEVLFADNVDFRGVQPVVGQVTADGQLLIGAGTSPNIRVNTLTAGPGISITNAPGAITIGLTGGATGIDSILTESGAPAVVPDGTGQVTFTGGDGIDVTGNGPGNTVTFAIDDETVGQTITGDTGGALSPTAGNWNILGQDTTASSVMDTNGTGSTLRVENRAWTSQFVVDPSATVGQRGTYQTIGAAITAAGAGPATIFIRPGTYTENITLPALVDLVSYDAGPTPTVTIVGKISATTAGRRTISGIRLQTNADNICAVTGTAATVVFFKNCFFNIANGTGFVNSSTSASALIDLQYCFGDSSGNVAFCALSSPGGIGVYYCNITGSGWTNGASTVSDGVFTLSKTDMRLRVTSSSTGWLNFDRSNVTCTDATPITVNGTGTASEIEGCIVTSGAQSAISIGAGATANVIDCELDSSNTNVITGAGAIVYGGLTFIGTSSNINVTTQTVRSEGPSRTIGSANTGVANTFTVINSSNTASSVANILTTVGGATAGDAMHQFTVTGATTFSHGIDNSDSDALVTSASNALGTTNVARCSTAGEWTYPLQPSFAAYNSTSDTNQTGNGATATIDLDTEVFDRGGDFAADTFTAPVTGIYWLHGHVYMSSIVSMETFQFDIVTSNRTYRWEVPNSIDSNRSMQLTVLADMDAADTATIAITILGGAGNTATITGSASTGGLIMTYMSGALTA